MQNNRKSHNPGKVLITLRVMSVNAGRRKRGWDDGTTQACSLHATGYGRIGPRIIGWMMLASCIAAAAGCAGHPTPAGSDPLVGEIHPTKPNPYGPTPSGPAAAPGKVSAVDPLLGSPSDLAPIANSRPSLAIDNTAPSTFTAAFTAGYTSTSGSAPVVRPLGDPTNQTGGTIVPGTPTSEELQAQLRWRGVIWQKLETFANGVRFSCVAPSRYNPEGSISYTAEAPDVVSAVQAVLMKIDRE